jgi:hypothetical protein
MQKKNFIFNFHFVPKKISGIKTVFFLTIFFLDGLNLLLAGNFSKQTTELFSGLKKISSITSKKISGITLYKLNKLAKKNSEQTTELFFGLIHFVFKNAIFYVKTEKIPLR